MGATKIQDVQDQVQKFWSPLFMKELREKLLLGGVVNREYEGDLKNEGDTVQVSQIQAPKGELRTVGVDADSFRTEKLKTLKVDVKADKRAVAAYEFQDLVMLQSQIGSQDSEIRASMLFAVEKQINDFLYSLVAPIAANDITGITPFNAAQVTAARKRGANNKWNRLKPWWLFAGPGYYKNMLDDSTLVSADFVDDAPVIGGQIISKRFGWNIVEDDSRPDDFALAFHPDFLYLVMQTQPTFQISSLHGQNKFGFNMSVDLVLGAKIGIDGGKKHQRIVN